MMHCFNRNPDQLIYHYFSSNDVNRYLVFSYRDYLAKFSTALSSEQMFGHLAHYVSTRTKYIYDNNCFEKKSNLGFLNFIYYSISCNQIPLSKLELDLRADFMAAFPEEVMVEDAISFIKKWDAFVWPKMRLDFSIIARFKSKFA